MAKAKMIAWRNPADYGQTVAQRLARLWLYFGILDGKNVKETPGIKRQRGRYLSEIQFLESLGGEK